MHHGLLKCGPGLKVCRKDTKFRTFSLNPGGGLMPGLLVYYARKTNLMLIFPPLASEPGRSVRDELPIAHASIVRLQMPRELLSRLFADQV
jgi:hypothetical protein